MTAKDTRNWLGKYFLLTTSVLGGYVLLCGETPLLPIRRAEALDCFQIVVPVLVGQLTIIFRWFAVGDKIQDDAPVDMPDWVVKGPPLIVIALISAAAIALVAGNVGKGSSWAPSPESFKGMVTFAVSLLNATTIFILARYFEAAKTVSLMEQEKGSSGS
jgi:hypothetical protein